MHTQTQQPQTQQPQAAKRKPTTDDRELCIFLTFQSAADSMTAQVADLRKSARLGELLSGPPGDYPPDLREAILAGRWEEVRRLFHENVLPVCWGGKPSGNSAA